MKKFLVIIITLMFSNNCLAEVEEGWIPTAQYAPEKDMNPNKNMADGMIELFYKNPDAIAAMDKNCEDWERNKGHFPGESHSNNTMRQCIIWEMNKKISLEEREALTWPKNSFENVLDKLWPAYTMVVGHNWDILVELDVRLFNIIMKTDWPECPYEANKLKYATHKEPCNIDGDTKKRCLAGSEDVIECMKEKLLSRYAELTTTKYHKEGIAEVNKTYRSKKPIIEEEYFAETLNYMKELLEKTEAMMNVIIKNKKQRKVELIKIFNFYELLINQYSITVISYITAEDRYMQSLQEKED